MPPVLSVVIPVYNGGPEIARNVEIIRDAVTSRLPPGEVEVVVVSDGSIDGTAERVLEQALLGVRVIHYDRNLGKGYAVKAGSLATTGDWVGVCDSDLDLDPFALPMYLEVAQAESLDIAVGSKRHPDSIVSYPRSRRVVSWGYQQLTRVLFGLHVRDTQVGLKVFSRDVADEVMPLLLVKRFAFDLELLAVASALGRGRIQELPIRLDYRFTGSAVGSRAVARALWDTAAVFYRLRILRTYQRKRRLLERRRRDVRPLVSVIGTTTDRFDYEPIEVVGTLEEARGTVVARVAPDARPAGNWVAACVPLLATPGVEAVVCPHVAPASGGVKARAGAATLESRFGGGWKRIRYVPGNLRVVRQYPADTVVALRTTLDEAAAAGVGADRLVSWLATQSRTTLYTPETVVVAPAPEAVRPVVRAVASDARLRGELVRATGRLVLDGSTVLSLVPGALVLVGVGVGALVPSSRIAVGAATAYGALLLVNGGVAALRYRSPRVGALTIPTLVAAQAAFVAGFLAGLVRPRTETTARPDVMRTA